MMNIRKRLSTKNNQYQNYNKFNNKLTKKNKNFNKNIN